MDKKTKYARNGALILGVGNAILNAVNQLHKLKNGPERKFDWIELLRAMGKGALVGGSGGFVIGAIEDYQNSLIKPISTDVFLSSVVDRVRLSKNDHEYIALNDQASCLIELLKSEFEEKLEGEPIRLGSTENGTALAHNFDIDIGLTFKPGSFVSTGDMFSCLINFLEKFEGKNSIVEIRDQKKSVGVVLGVGGIRKRIDIVPYKLSTKRHNRTSGYLYVNDANNPTYTKTDIHSLKNFKLTETQKKIIVALKYWKSKNDLPLSSHLLQNFVRKAYSHRYIPNKFTDKLMVVMAYIKDNIQDGVVRSIENTNNILTNIPESAKVEIFTACKDVIEDFEYQPNSIQRNFGLS
jgi:hypothetical protein